MEGEESDTLNSEASESEDLLLSDAEAEENATPSDQDIVLKIDCNARIVTQELKNEGDADDYNMHFIEKNNLDRRRSEDGLHTSTEDLNFSDDDDGKSHVLTLPSVNLDGMASTSASKDEGSLSTLDYSHTGFKNDFSAEFASDDESDNIKGHFFKKDRNKSLPPGLMVAGLSTAVKNAASVILPSSQKALNSLNIKNVFANSLLLDEDVQGLQDDQESPPMTCLEFLKSEISDGNITDAEDISVGSLDDIGEVSKRHRNLSGRGGNTPVSLSELSINGYIGNVKNLGTTDSRRSSVAELHTEDETFQMEKFPDCSQKRVKKRNFRLREKDAGPDSGTDEEML